jgi:hypothetical protein
MMKRKNCLMALFRLALLQTLLFVFLPVSFCLLAPEPAEAQLLRNSLKNRLPRRWELPLGLGRPANREGGATRGEDCLPPDRKFTALVPPSGKTLTAEAYPRFFWYLPKTSATGVEFILTDQNNKEIYSTSYLLAKNLVGNEGGKILNLQLPDVAGIAPLEIGREYQWNVALICDPTDRSADVILKATIVVVALDPNLSSSLSSATAEEKIVLYADNRLWNETLETLQELIRTNPDDANLQEAWAQLFDSVGLNSIDPNNSYLNSVPE